MKILPKGGEWELFHADRTDGQDAADRRFSQFCEKRLVTQLKSHPTHVQYIANVYASCGAITFSWFIAPCLFVIQINTAQRFVGDCVYHLDVRTNFRGFLHTP